MISWKRHQRKDLQAVLEIFAAHGWRIEHPPRYYRLRCLPLINLWFSHALVSPHTDFRRVLRGVHAFPSEVVREVALGSFRGKWL